MPQVAVADAVQLPPDGTGKLESHFRVNIGGTDLYLPAVVLVDSTGNTVDPKSSTSTVTNVAASATSVTLIAANSAREALYITNAGTSALYVRLGAVAATTTTGYSAVIQPGILWELPTAPIYTGEIRGIWAATGGNGANITELT